MADWIDDWKFGDIALVTIAGGSMHVMVVCPGTEPGIRTDEGIDRHTGGYVVLVLERSFNHEYWPVHGTAAAYPGQMRPVPE